MIVKVVSFASGPAYEQALLRLQTSLGTQLFEVSNCDLKDWRSAVMYKPTFIQQMLLRLDDKIDGVLWTDADSVLKRPPPWKDLAGCDLAFATMRRSPMAPEEALTGTMYFSRSHHAVQFIEEWVLRTPVYEQDYTPEGKSFEATLRDWPNLRIKKLDPEWCWIYDTSKEMYGERQPIFEHYQMSRQERFKPARPGETRRVFQDQARGEDR